MPMMMTHLSTTALWQQLVFEAAAICDTILSHEIEAYLVYLLQRYTNRPTFTDGSIAIKLMAALQSRTSSRELGLQGVADACLLFTGFFPGIARKRLVKIKYYIDLGRGAYYAMSKMKDDVYYGLGQDFVLVMDILQVMRQPQHSISMLPLEAYELWHDTGSKHAFKTLQSYTSMQPAEDQSDFLLNNSRLNDIHKK